MFPTNIKPNNPEEGDCITNHVTNQHIDQVSRAMLLLKMCFTHGLSIESAENIERFHKSMTGRSPILGR